MHHIQDNSSIFDIHRTNTQNNSTNKNTAVPNHINFTIYTDCKIEELEDFVHNITYFKRNCTGKYEVQCTYGCSRCFSVYKLCVYELDHHSNLMHCPSGAHIKKCIEMECNNMFKCYQHNCVPFRYSFLSTDVFCSMDVEDVNTNFFFHSAIFVMESGNIQMEMMRSCAAHTTALGYLNVLLDLNMCVCIQVKFMMGFRIAVQEKMNSCVNYTEHVQQTVNVLCMQYFAQMSHTTQVCQIFKIWH